MLQTYTMCTVWGEPLSQTAQSFMPELLFGVNRNLPKVSPLLVKIASAETIDTSFFLQLPTVLCRLECF